MPMPNRNKSGRHQQSVIPLEALLTEDKEKPVATKPIVAVGKVGKWGVTSFTSIRTAYRVGLQTTPPTAPSTAAASTATTTTSATANQGAGDSEADDAAAEPREQPAAPRPRKFFKSRASPSASQIQIIAAPVVPDDLPTPRTNHHPVAAKKEKKVKKPKKPEIARERPATRVSTRHRKQINYNEDDSASVSSAALTNLDAPPAGQQLLIPKPAPVSGVSPTPPHLDPEESEIDEKDDDPEPEEHPKIVLRISKKTLKVVENMEESHEPAPVVPTTPAPPTVSPPPSVSTAAVVDSVIPSTTTTDESSPEKPRLVKKLCIRKQAKDFAIREPTPPTVPDEPAQAPEPEPEPEPPEPVRALRKRGREPKKALPEEENVEPTPTKMKMTPEKRILTRRAIEKLPEPPAQTTQVTRRTRTRAKAMQDKNEVQNMEDDDMQAHEDSDVPAAAPGGAAATATGGTTGAADEKPSVKLVISKKKGSIFKSRALVNDSGNKRHVYKHKWDDDDEEEPKEKVPLAKMEKKAVETKMSSMDFDFDEPKEINEAAKEEKRPASYTFVRNVKKAHQMQEIGEFQELDDDVEYILSALQPDNPTSTRCLSALQLASKCITPAFRMHVRAHGIVTKFFKALQDAPNDPNLGLCTATVLFVLSQDTLNMDLDRDSLELMLNLLDVSKEKKVTGSSQAQLQKNKKKVKDVCAEIKGLGKATHLNLENISIGTLAMETLLSLTSKRAGEWFKEELRTLGGLDHIMRTVCDCCQQISDYVAQWSEDLLDKLRKIERCLRVLENVTQQNQENQNHVLNYNNGTAVEVLVKFYKLCDTEISLYPTNDTTPKDNPGCIIREALTPTLKVLINLTHPFNAHAEGSVRVGRSSGIFDTSLHLLLMSPNYVPESCVFDISILVLLLLINLTTYTDANRNAIMQAHAPTDFGSQFARVPAIKAIVKFFYKCEEFATMAEKNTDAILDSPAEKESKSQEEVDQTVTKLLQKAGHHMEHTMLGSYVSILIGHLIVDNENYKSIITQHLQGGSFAAFAKILEKYYNFMNLTAISEATVVEHVKSTKKMLDYLKELD